MIQNLSRKLIHVLAITSLTACTYTYYIEKEPEENLICPLVNVQTESYTRLVLNEDAFQISLVGYEGCCNMSTLYNQSCAGVAPVFEIRRFLAGEIEKINFQFKVTAGGVSHTYKETAYIPKSEKSIRYVGQKVKIPLPEAQKYNYGITIELLVNPEIQKYNNDYFDIHYNADRER